MGKSLKNWIDFKESSESITYDNTYGNLQEQIAKLIEFYKETSMRFDVRHDKITSMFKLLGYEKKAVRFGVISTKNKQLQKFVDILNSDACLKNLYSKIENTLLEGNLLILKLIQSEKITLPGYDLAAFIADPKFYKEDIMHLVVGLWGFRHFWIVDDLVMSEIPARVYISERKEIVYLVEKWVDGLDIIIDDTKM